MSDVTAFSASLHFVEATCTFKSCVHKINISANIITHKKNSLKMDTGVINTNLVPVIAFWKFLYLSIDPIHIVSKKLIKFITIFLFINTI